MKISLILPVYNGERFLERAIESVLNQSYTNFELIVVNDGSTDASLSICQQFEQIDNRIKVIDKANGGVSSARNVGVSHASGMFSIHLDADDWIESHMLETMIEKIGENDVLITDFYYDDSYGKARHSIQRPSSLQTGGLIEDIMLRKLHGSMCNKLIRHSIYNTYKIRFPEQLGYCEDQITLIRILNNTNKIVYHNEAFYHYCLNSESATGTLNYNYFKKTILYFDYIEKNQDLSIENRLLIENKLLTKADMMYSKIYSSNEIIAWEASINKYLLRSSLTFFTKLRLLLHFFNLGRIAKYTY
ncbi:MAG: hypothetical protein K0S24_1514 [Sphingobacterium sp.]|jgi:glycosyltransferase involved in cell wall biosynthesis|nr:hypothetical protein [Sphingobacterium sp.]